VQIPPTARAFRRRCLSIDRFRVADARLSRAPRMTFILVALVAASLVFAAAAFAAISTYHNGGMVSGQIESTCCFYSRDFNRVYRPGGYVFQLGYSADGQTISWAAPNTWDNPFVDQRNATSAIAFCNNYSSYFVTPVTCQTTVP